MIFAAILDKDHVIGINIGLGERIENVQLNIVEIQLAVGRKVGQAVNGVARRDVIGFAITGRLQNVIQQGRGNGARIRAALYTIFFGNLQAFINRCSLDGHIAIRGLAAIPCPVAGNVQIKLIYFDIARRRVHNTAFGTFFVIGSQMRIPHFKAKAVGDIVFTRNPIIRRDFCRLEKRHPAIIQVILAKAVANTQDHAIQAQFTISRQSRNLVDQLLATAGIVNIRHLQIV